MKRKWIFVLAPIGIVVFAVIGGQVVLLLWNWLMPMLFGWKLITFWQALGLFALCRILFGGLGMRGRHHSHFRKRWDDRWEQMTPEEREKVRQGLHGRWGCGAPPPDSKPTA